MQEANELVVDYAFIAQKADVGVHGLIDVANGGINRLVVGSLGKEWPLAFVVHIHTDSADAPTMYTCRVTAEPLHGGGQNGYGAVGMYTVAREGGFLVLPVVIQAFVPGEYRLKLHVTSSDVESDVNNNFNSSTWPVIADLPLIIQ